MRIAIIHYHLEPGGVSKVIQDTATQLQKRDLDFVILTGEKPPASWQKFPCEVVKGLAYEEKRPTNLTPQELKKEILTVCKQSLKGTPDIFHIHNPTLGKNLLLPQVIYLLAKENFKLLLHIHDFPEDGRPANYKLLLNHLGNKDFDQLGDFLYPQGGNIHYLFLTSKDQNIFLQAKAKNTHVLPNPINPPQLQRQSINNFPQKKLWLYPTRGIRRKNLGEFVLWSLFTTPQDILATTLAPKNPRYLPYFNFWKSFSQKHNLPIYFELSKKYSFTELFNEAHFCFTTSISEGFGLVFLEPWLMEKPLLGRDLPDITKDFKQKNIDLSHLYPKLEIPLKALDKDKLFTKIKNKLKLLFSWYDLKIEKTFIEETVSCWTENNLIDFGKLDEELQSQFIEKQLQKYLIDLNLPPKINQNTILNNKEVILKEFSPNKYISKLISIYKKLLQTEGKLEGSLDALQLLKIFLSPNNLSLLKIDV